MSVRGARKTVERLARGPAGRTEADIQSDVRKFLLDAPLELDDDDLFDVSLEAHVEGGGRIDVEAGFAAIEVKKSLASPRVIEKALVQLAHYVRRRTEERGQRYVGILTDGRTWMLTHLEPDGVLVEVSRFVVGGGDDAPRLAAWLEPVLASTDRVEPVPDEIRRRLGAASAAAQLDLADLRALYHRWSQRTLYGADDDLVFAHPQSGRPLDRTKLTRRFKAACVEAGVRPIRFHDLRHTFATRLAASGQPMRTIQEFLGHADSKTTQIYAHYAPSAHEVEMVNAAFSEEEPAPSVPSARADPS
jgi:hypothetical protein